MNNTLPRLLIFAALILLASCRKKGPDYTRFIPKDASNVIALDVKSMVTKLEKDSLSVDNMLEVLKDSSDPSKYSKAIEIWKQFKDAGLDLDNKVFLVVPSFSMGGGTLRVEVLAGLKDEKKLEAFVSKLPDAPKLTKDGDLTYAVNGESVIGWNKEAVMILGGHSTPQMANFNEDTTISSVPAPVPGSDTGLVAKMKKYFQQNKGESIASLDEFNNLVNEKADIAIFTNSNSLASSAAAPGLTMMPKVKEMLEGIYSATTIDFENGKILMKSKTFAGPKLSELLKKYAGPTVDMNLLEAYPGNNICGVVAFSFNPELIPAFLKETGFDALVDLGLSQQGITSADIIKAFKGDFAILFSDFSVNKVTKISEEGTPRASTEPEGKMVFATRINDKASFEKILSLGTKTGMIVKQGNRLYPAKNSVIDTTEKLFIGIENDLLVLSNDQAIYQGYVAKKGGNDLSSDAKTAIKGSTIAFYMDAQKLLNGIPETIFDSSTVHEKNVFNHSKNVFRTFDFTMGNYDGKKIEGRGEVTMASDKNSLSQMVKFLMYAAAEMKLKDAEREEKWHSEEFIPDSAKVLHP